MKAIDWRMDGLDVYEQFGSAGYEQWRAMQPSVQSERSERKRARARAARKARWDAFVNADQWVVSGTVALAGVILLIVAVAVLVVKVVTGS